MLDIKDRMTTLHIKNKDCLEAMKQMPDDSVSGILCDPPYGLEFMGRGWDSFTSSWHTVWLREAYRVLKPNGVVRAFSASRTLHWILAAMEEVGFEDIRIEVWHYVNGFPKSLNISKDIDRQEGYKRDIVGWKFASQKGVSVAESRGAVGAGSFGQAKEIPITKPKGENAKQWEGWGTALKPSFEPIAVGYKR